jgi:solute carrier family 25 citrate transporter 1
MTAVAKKESRKPSVMQGALSGGISGALAICVTYPTEYLKTQMQLYKEFSKKGMFQCAKDTYKKWGPLGFYRGLDTLLYFSIPKVGVRFAVNEFCSSNIFTEKSRTSIFFNGMISGVFEALLVVTPMETLKVKLIHDRFQEVPKFRNFFHGVYMIYKEHGFDGMYKGALATVARQSSNAGIRFLVYDETKHFFEKHANFMPHVMQLFLAGSVAGAVNVFANGPIDVVKTNMQGLSAHKYKNTFDCGYQIWQHEGIRGLYKGTVPRLSRLVIDVGLTFTFYEYINRLIDSFFYRDA